jgi:hypothetical protein
VRRLEVGEVVKHVLEGYGVGIVLVPPKSVHGKTKMIEVLTQTGRVAQWFTDLVQKP